MGNGNFFRKLCEIRYASESTQKKVKFSGYRPEQALGDPAG
jgi:hypothetical protein